MWMSFLFWKKAENMWLIQLHSLTWLKSNIFHVDWVEPFGHCLQLAKYFFSHLFLFSHLVPLLEVCASSLAASISVISVAGSPSPHWIFIFALEARGVLERCKIVLPFLVFTFSNQTYAKTSLSPTHIYTYTDRRTRTYTFLNFYICEDFPPHWPSDPWL